MAKKAKSTPATKVLPSYWEAIAIRVAELDSLAQTYLDKFEFVTNDEMLQRIWDAANQSLINHNDDFNAIPEWAANVLEGGLSFYCNPSKNGSIYYALALSVVSKDAHLRNLLERAEGRETQELEFAIIAEKEIVDKLCGLA